MTGNRDPKQQGVCQLPDAYVIPLFVFGAYLISWVIWFGGMHVQGVFRIELVGLAFEIPRRAVPLLLGNLGPGLAATAVVGLTQGRRGIRELWAGLTRERVRAGWLIFVILLFPVLVAIGLLGYMLVGGRIITTGSPLRWLLLVVVNLPFAPLWEEIGWRGFLLPRLESRYGGLLGTMILASVWAPWHLPLYWNSSLEYLVCIFVMILALSVIFTWVYNRSQGNLVPVVFLHAMVNSTSLYLLWPTLAYYGMRPFLFVVGALMFAAVTLVISEVSTR